MRDELFKELMESARQAVAISRGEMEPARVHKFEDAETAASPFQQARVTEQAPRAGEGPTRLL